MPTQVGIHVLSLNSQRHSDQLSASSWAAVSGRASTRARAPEPTPASIGGLDTPGHVISFSMPDEFVARSAFIRGLARAFALKFSAPPLSQRSLFTRPDSRIS